MSIEKKELVASFFVALFALIFVIASMSEVPSTGYSLFDTLSMVGMTMIFCQLAFMPKMFFLPFMHAFKAEMPTLFLSRKAVSLIGALGFALFVVGFLGARIF